MEKLTFTYNWNNKLTGKFFTTLRLHSPKKFFPGAEFEIHLKQGHDMRELCKATVIEVRSIKLSQINAFISGIDTGYCVSECVTMIRSMYKNMNVNWETQLLDFVLMEKKK